MEGVGRENKVNNYGRQSGDPVSWRGFMYIRAGSAPVERRIQKRLPNERGL